MERVILDSIEFAPDPAEIGRELPLKEGSEAAEILARLCAEAVPIAQPRALYGAAEIGDRGDDFVVIDGERFTSRVLAVNVSGLGRVFPMLATCGPELQEWAGKFSDDLDRFLAEAVKGAALKAALLACDHDLAARFNPGKVSNMAPGELAEWPLDQQVPLFRLLGDAAAIGVHLLDTLFMSPNMTRSCIAFPSEHGFESCRLCPREKCPGRRALYEADAVKRYMG